MQRGFTLIEALLATVVVLVGLVAVAQLVPTSVMLNSNNRSDATALVFAQHVIEGMRSQPLTAVTYIDSQGVCARSKYVFAWRSGATVDSDEQSGNSSSGLPVRFFQAPVAGYASPTRIPALREQRDVRWAVLTRPMRMEW